MVGSHGKLFIWPSTMKASDRLRVAGIIIKHIRSPISQPSITMIMFTISKVLKRFELIAPEVLELGTTKKLAWYSKDLSTMSIVYPQISIALYLTTYRGAMHSDIASHFWGRMTKADGVLYPSSVSFRELSKLSLMSWVLWHDFVRAKIGLMGSLLRMSYNYRVIV